MAGRPDRLTALGARWTMAAFAAVLGLGSAALLYLAAEELLPEAHEIPEMLPITASFFAGFVLLLLL